MQRTLISITITACALLSACLSGSDSGSGNGPTKETGIDAATLIDALVHNDADQPGYAWSFSDTTFLLERREAAALPPEIVRKTMGSEHDTSWVRGEWKLAEGGTELQLTECRCYSSSESIRGSGVLSLEKGPDGSVVIDGSSYQVQAGAAQDRSLNGKARLVSFKDRDSNRLGYRNSLTGEVELPAIYKIAWEFSSDGLACVWDEEPFIINDAGEQIVQPLWIDNAPDPFKEGLARYVDGQGKIGFYDALGNIRVPAEWSYAEPYEGSYALVCDGGSVTSLTDSSGVFTGHKLRPGSKWGMVNRRGDIVLKAKYPNLERGEGSMVRIAAGEPWFQVGGVAALDRE